MITLMNRPPHVQHDITLLDDHLCSKDGHLKVSTAQLILLDLNHPQASLNLPFSSPSCAFSQFRNLACSSRSLPDILPVSSCRLDFSGLPKAMSSIGPDERGCSWVLRQLSTLIVEDLGSEKKICPRQMMASYLTTATIPSM